MSKALSIPADRQARLLSKALARLEDAVEKGGERAAMDAIKVILAQVLPAPAKVTQQVLVASAGDRGQAIALEKVSARSLLTGPEATDATFTDVRTLRKGPK